MRYYKVSTAATQEEVGRSCDHCGKKLSPRETASWTVTMGYPARLDGETFQTDLCWSCIEGSAFLQKVLRLISPEGGVGAEYPRPWPGHTLEDALRFYDQLGGGAHS